MKQNIKKLFVEALHSGKYNQIYGRLKCDDGFCALGVLCELYRDSKDGRDHNAQWYSRGLPLIDGTVWGPNTLPPIIADWADMNNSAARILVQLNDERHLTFEEIADSVATLL